MPLENSADYLLQRGRQPDDIERFFSGWIIRCAVPGLPVSKEFFNQLLLVLIRCRYEIVGNTVCFCHPGDIMDIEVGDRRTYCLAFFIDHRMVDQGNIDRLCSGTRHLSHAQFPLIFSTCSKR